MYTTWPRAWLARSRRIGRPTASPPPQYPARRAPAVAPRRPPPARAGRAGVAELPARLAGPPDPPEHPGAPVGRRLLPLRGHHPEVHHVQDRAVVVEPAVHRPLQPAVEFLRPRPGLLPLVDREVVDDPVARVDPHHPAA